MSPRHNKRRRDEKALDEGQSRRAVEHEHDERDGAWTVRHLPGDPHAKTYRCPGCDQEIRPGAAHVVAWPTDGWGNESDRRHWHSNCWRSRHQRQPNVQRSRNAPRYG